MAEDGEDGSDELRVPFVFVPDGAPDPVEWMAAHPGWVRVPATLRPDPRPRFTHPDAALPTGTPTRNFPAGTPVSLGAIVPGVSRTTRFPRTKRFPRQGETTRFDDSVEQYLRISQMMEEAARGYAPPVTIALPDPQPAGSAVRQAEAMGEPSSPARPAVGARHDEAPRGGLRLAETDPAEEDEPIGPEGRPLSPQEEIDRDEYYAAAAALTKLDPNNPQLVILTSPGWVPNDDNVSRIQAELSRVRQLRSEGMGEQKRPSSPSSRANADDANSQKTVDIVMPGGRLVGVVSGRTRSLTTRTLSRAEFEDLKRRLLQGATSTQPPSGYKGAWYTRSDGSSFGMRVSDPNGETIDVPKTRGISRQIKVHYND